MKNNLAAHLACVGAALLATLLALSAIGVASTPHTIYTFPANGADGFPSGGLVFDSAGNLYGTTDSSGTSNYGTVFELSLGPNGVWIETVLYRFKGAHFGGGNNQDGESPQTGVIIDGAGNLYGTTTVGGTIGTCQGGCGTAFKLSPDGHGGWTESVIYRFYGIKGKFPYGLVRDAAGTLYGTTLSGGSFGHGTVFRLKQNLNGTWSETVLHNFAGGADGFSPYAGLVLDNAGNLYGTTLEGGDYSVCSIGCGTVFTLTRAGKTWTERVIYNFNYPDGAYPDTPLTVDSAGNLYGTSFGGDSHNDGVVYRLAPSNGIWTESVLHYFGSPGDGSKTYVGVVLDGAGNLFGTTPFGLSYDGNIFELTPTPSGPWTETILYSPPLHSGTPPTSALTWNAAHTSLFGIAATIVYEIAP